MNENSNHEKADSGVDSGRVTEAMFRWFQDQQARHLADVKRDRFWRNVRTGIVALGLLSGPLLLAVLSGGTASPWTGGPYAALVRMTGVIGADESASAVRIGDALERAFTDKAARGVVLVIDSPGGSPVQSSLIHDRLIRLRAAYPDTKVWAVGEDMLTSGAYFVATAAPSICVNRSTVTGSIGVVQEGWGLDKAIDRIGIERRVFTAGEAKRRLDPFKPISAEDERKVREVLDAIHNQFKAVVREGRGARLKGDEQLLFSGDFWVGSDAVKLGLVDELCDLDEVLHKKLGVKHARDYTPPPSLLNALTGAAVTQVRAQLLAESGGAKLLPR